jgi:hypothetical protein
VKTGEIRLKNRNRKQTLKLRTLENQLGSVIASAETELAASRQETKEILADLQAEGTIESQRKPDGTVSYRLTQAGILASEARDEERRRRGVISRSWRSVRRVTVTGVANLLGNAAVLACRVGIACQQLTNRLATRADLLLASANGLDVTDDQAI